MKKIFFLVLFLIFQKLIAQDSGNLKHSFNQKNASENGTPQALFAEFGGRSCIFSVNYDRRFSNRYDGFGFSVGAGYFQINNINLFSIPASINYLVGKSGKYLELGAGATYFNARISDNNDASAGGHTFVGTMTIGFRSQPINGGFMFRIGINPLLFEDTFIPYWPYLSLGINF
jgi:hypothetical protein